MPSQEEVAVSTVGGAAKPTSAIAILTCAWPALLLATACLVPFLNKAFNIDDPYFLTLAQQIVKHPAHPMDFSICWNAGPGDECTKAYQFAAGNALRGQVGLGYVLVPTILGGAQEWMVHLTQLVLAWIAVVAMTALIFRFGWGRRHAIAGALFLVAIPPFLPMASTAMPDLLATALALIAMERLAAWKAEEKWSQCAAAAVALGLAGFARPHLTFLLPLGALFLVDSTQPKAILAQIRHKYWLWTPVFAGAGLLFAGIVAVREHNLAISLPPDVLEGQHLLPNLLTFLLFFAFPLPLAACWMAKCWNEGRRRTVLGLSAAVAAPWLLHGHPPIGTVLEVGGLAVVGCIALAALSIETLKRRDLTGLFLLLWILLPLPIVYYAHLPIKYLLPCMPAVILLCFRLMENLPVRTVQIATTAFIVAGTFYSLLILRSDAEFANFGRDALYRLIEPQVASGEKVWFSGQYWSYWYAPLAGATLTYPGGPQPRPGDLFVSDTFSWDQDPLRTRFPHRTLVATMTHRYRFGRTMGDGIGLYAGPWLWGFGDSGNDRFELWRID